MKTLIAAAAVTVTTFSAFAETKSPIVSDTRSSKDFELAFCGADRSNQHIFILPLEIFTPGASVTCDHGVSNLRITEPDDDPGHLLVNIDPPEGSVDGFDCDAKLMTACHWSQSTACPLTLKVQTTAETAQQPLPLSGRHREQSGLR